MVVRVKLDSFVKHRELPRVEVIISVVAKVPVGVITISLAFNLVLVMLDVVGLKSKST